MNVLLHSNWFVVLVVMLVTSIVLFIWAKKIESVPYRSRYSGRPQKWWEKPDAEYMKMWAISLIVVFTILNLILWAVSAVNTKQAYSYPQIKYNIESNDGNNLYRDALMAESIMDWNEWLFYAQYSVSHRGNWSLVPAEVATYEPIFYIKEN